MKSIRFSFFIIILVFIISFTHQNSFSNQKQSSLETVDSQTSNSSVVWEPKPKRIAEGTDGQLRVEVSEKMSLLYAFRNKEGKQDLNYSKSYDIGGHFSKPIRVNSDAGELSAHGENGPRLRSGKGIEIFASWVGNGDIKFSRSMNFGRSFLPSIRVNDDEGKEYQSFFTMEVAPTGSPYIVWLDGRDKNTNSPGTSSIYIAWSDDRGSSFGKNVKISGEICPCCRPALAFGDNGEIFVSWRHVYEGNERIIVVASSQDGGRTWSAPVPVTKKGWTVNGCAHSGPTMSYVNGKLIVAWYTAAENKANVKMAYSLDNGKTFNVAKDIQGRITDANHPHMAVQGNEAWVTFQGRDPDTEGGWGENKAWLVRISSNGEPSKPEVIPSAGGGVAYPYLFIGNGGRVYATWTEHGENGLSVVLCRGRIRS